MVLSCGVPKYFKYCINTTLELKYPSSCDEKIFALLKNSNIFEPRANICNSERSEECIDFTMIITSRNNAPISNYEGGFRYKSEYPWCIIEVKS
ncbi:Uncharacterized protein FWK35_00024356 [Aphis craccivora]|uniref:Uncharacterized protein n=1 Tax=Aphis craccivora TaxID=307492 RepID=A0A6G0Y1M0_APHCR|nr:Uncharacterized protein FWK35_00024356 [Aphis craccivora]